jgi:hypothetical protein
MTSNATLTVDDVVWRLASLASFPYQERYVLNGTKDEYLVPEELINDVDALRFWMHRPENQSLLSKDQLASLSSLLAVIEQTDNDKLGFNASVDRLDFLEIFRTGDCWQLLRSKAAESLVSFGFDIESMSVEDIERIGSERDGT